MTNQVLSWHRPPDWEAAVDPHRGGKRKQDLLRYCNTNPPETFSYFNSMTDNRDFEQAGRPNQTFVRWCCRICIDSKPISLLT